MQDINLNGQSLDVVKGNVEKLKQLFPEIVTEDNIDFDKLKAVLGEYIEKNDENYRFTWFGKRDAFRKSQTPSTGTLRPCIEESKDWDTTQNLYIEGDNLEVLKLLQKSYNNKIKMIYIDPPYNKDKDFIYPDKWSDPIKEYKMITGQLDDEENIITSDTENEGGRHTKWLNMMYSRLSVAKRILSDDGLIFISIDETEQANIKKICDEIFGEENYYGELTWESTTQPINSGDAKFNLQQKVEPILLYAKDKNRIKGFILERVDSNFKYPHKGKLGKCRFEIIEKSDAGDYNRPTMKFTILGEYPREGKRWQIGEDTAIKLENTNRIEVVDGIVKRAIYPEDELEKLKFRPFWSHLPALQFGTAQSGKDTLNTLMGTPVGFDTVKPVRLLKEFISHLSNDLIVLDFFSGSATTAHSVMQINAEDGGNRKFIMVQLPEEIQEKSDAYKAGYINIAELGKERIRRSGEKIKSEMESKYDEYQQKKQSSIEDNEEAPMKPEDLDIGFKVFKLDNSNLKKWSADVGEDFYSESKEVQNSILSEMLGFEVDNFIEGRTELDVVYEIMLKYGLDLTYPIETYNFDGTNVYSIGFGGLIVCLDREIKAEFADKIVELIKKLQPSMVRVAVRDIGFESDSEKTNFKETLKNGIYAYFENSEDKASKQNQFKFITI